ncbi:DNA methyltransferase [Streptomyces sp. MMS21 TC-5]|uniref:type ISP restriction/modification enzyme n=1 Tax=Streptomyces sp. MMS21 TC-5 TaxID=2925833 RepID=UPI001F60768E|nr:type ISP restriction/modification enzyme [Streptomyces sp. MMS21 TC-5]MCI4080683.1 DNA methyltransferase [Streptomyces sp. MMS21 TC-5]
MSADTPQPDPLLDDLMPWAVGGLRLGRDWVVSPDPAALRTRWSVLAGAEGVERDRLFRPSRSRTPTASAAALPGQRSAGTARFADAPGPCPDPVRVLREPFDEQWLLPDQRLIDTARPELWRVLDEHQLFLVEAPEPLVTAHLPAGRLGRIRPLHRRPGGAEPNLAPGLLPLLAERHGGWVTPEDVLCWILAAGRPGPRGYEVPLAADPGRWRAGLELGHRLLTVQLRGARGGGGAAAARRAPPVRPLGGRGVAGRARVRRGDRDAGAGERNGLPVPAGAWEFEVQGVRVLESWFAARTAHCGPEADGLAALGPAEWPQSWTSELLALVTTLALLAELAPERAAFEPGPGLPAADLRAAGVLPPPAWSRRPASVLDHQEEGPGGQFALL